MKWQNKGLSLDASIKLIYTDGVLPLNLLLFYLLGMIYDFVQLLVEHTLQFFIYLLLFYLCLPNVGIKLNVCSLSLN